MEGKHEVFLCYRRSTNATEAETLRNWIDALFGPCTAFKDESGIEAGELWRDKLRVELDTARAVFVVIGPDWVKAPADEHGRRRIDQADDFVRQEIEAALAARRRGAKSVYPVLVGGAQLPTRDALPEDLGDLTELQADALHLSDLADTMQKLRSWLEKDLGRKAFQHEEAIALPREQDPLQKYREHLRERHRNLVSFFPEAGDRVLDDIYVEIAVERELSGLDAFRTRGKEHSPPHPEDPASGSTRLRDLLARHPAPETDVQPRWVVLGEPGAGKSTIARHLTWSLAGGDALDDPIPVYVPLATWAGRDVHVFDLADAGAGDEAHRKALAERLRRLAGPDGEPGRIWLLLDGLDEVAPEHIETTRERLNVLAGDLPNARIAITTRAVGYRSLGDRFRHARLRPLDARRQKQLLERWLPAEAVGEVLRTLDAHGEIRQLAGNPLMLTLVARIVIPDGERPGEPAGLLTDKRPLPVTRSGLYARALDLLLRKPYGRQKQPIEHPDAARRVLRGLALALQESGAIAWTRDELYDALAAPRREQRAYAKELGRWKDPGVFLDECAERTGILGPHDGPDAPWKFLHRQFREFLAAEALRDAKRRWTRIVGKLDADTVPRWSESLGMLCGLVSAPRTILDALQKASPAATVRALSEVEGIPPRELLAFLLAVPSDPTHLEPTWNGDDLRAVVCAWRDRGLAAADELRELLWREIPPIDGRVARIRAAWLHFALATIGDVDRQRFFERCGCPIDRAPQVELVPIPGGTFTMGSPEDEPQRFDTEGPQHEVRVPQFALARTTVTNAQYLAFATDHDVRRWKDVSSAELGSHPVVNVSWWEAYLFCAWAGLRLPSEAEWEYACRAGTTGPFSFDDPPSPAVMNYNGNFPYAAGEQGPYRERTVAVGELPANPWGLHEMHGNVCEWCADRWHGDYHGAPPDGHAWIEDGSGHRVMRGGSWCPGAGDCRSACRARWPPGRRYDNVGFRPASSSLR